ncbi:MAG: COP23 domain-containing protein [Nostocaceae cyanobacterium]|nr:COP23 domain-containing protein [Nostocaceae cyanobacterium]
MKLQSLIITVSASAIALSSSMSLHQPAQAQSNFGQPTEGFYCDSSGSVPVTKYVNRRSGNIETWIRWSSNHFSNSGYDNLNRCQKVSRNLEIFRQKKILNFIKIGRRNNQNILCVAREENGKCEGIIYTLKHNQDPIKTLKQFMALREGKADAVPREESGSLPVIDMREKFNYSSGDAIDRVPSTSVNGNTDRTPSRKTPALREL